MHSPDREAVRTASPLDQVIAELTHQSIRSTTTREVKFCCPFHEDKAPSLRVNIEKQTYYCDPCHGGGDVFRFVERVRSCDFPGAMAFLIERAGLSGHSDSRVVATYDYNDESGTLLYQVCRFSPKDFRQRRPDGAGGWTWTLGNVRRVLFGLPDLHGRKVAYVVEGERDVLALRTLGLVATTNAGGAGKWRDEYSQQLKAQGIENVAIFPDNDDPGRAHSEAVAGSCHATGLRVKVVALPDLPAKGDVSDWLATGHTKGDLIALAKGTALYVPPMNGQADTAPPTRTPVITFMSDVTPEQVSWIWEGRIARGKYGLLSGEPGLGKTYLMTDAAARISTGRPWPDGSPAPHGRVLYLTAEDGLADTLRPRLDALGANPANVAVLEAVREVNGTRSSLSLVRDLDMLATAIRQVQPVLVVLDPISAYLGKTDTHRDSEVRSALAPVIDLIEQTQCGLVAIGHLSKDAQRAALHRPGGSIAFVAAARIVLALAADPHDPERRLLVPIKSNLCLPAPMLAYRITGQELAWEPDPVTDLDTEALFRPVSPGDREERSDAEAVLHDLMGDPSIWPLDAKTALAAGSAQGVHERSMQRTARRMGIEIRRLGFGNGGKWLWHLPPIGDSTPSTDTVSPMSSMVNPSGNRLSPTIDDTKSVFPRTREMEDIDAQI